MMETLGLGLLALLLVAAVLTLIFPPEKQGPA